MRLGMVRNARISGAFHHHRDPAYPGDIQRRILDEDLHITWEWCSHRGGEWNRQAATLPSGATWDMRARPDVSAWLLPERDAFCPITAVYDILSKAPPVLVDGKPMSQDHIDSLFFSLMLHSCDECDGPARCKLRLFAAQLLYKVTRSIIG